jgi:hypothetical protein
MSIPAVQLLIKLLHFLRLFVLLARETPNTSCPPGMDTFFDVDGLKHALTVRSLVLSAGFLHRLGNI